MKPFHRASLRKGYHTSSGTINRDRGYDAAAAAILDDPPVIVLWRYPDGTVLYGNTRKTARQLPRANGAEAWAAAERSPTRIAAFGSTSSATSTPARALSR